MGEWDGGGGGKSLQAGEQIVHLGEGTTHFKNGRLMEC